MYNDLHEKIEQLDYMIITLLDNPDSEFAHKVSYDWNQFKLSFDFAWDWYKMEQQEE